jgi:hypothetical protein
MSASPRIYPWGACQDKVYGRQTVVEVVERKGMIVNTRKEGSPLIRQASLQEWRDWCKKFNAVVVI